MKSPKLHQKLSNVPGTPPHLSEKLANGLAKAYNSSAVRLMSDVSAVK